MSIDTGISVTLKILAFTYEERLFFFQGLVSLYPHVNGNIWEGMHYSISNAKFFTTDGVCVRRVRKYSQHIHKNVYYICESLWSPQCIYKLFSFVNHIWRHLSLYFTPFTCSLLLLFYCFVYAFIVKNVIYRFNGSNA